MLYPSCGKGKGRVFPRNEFDGSSPYTVTNKTDEREAGERRLQHTCYSPFVPGDSVGTYTTLREKPEMIVGRFNHDLYDRRRWYLRLLYVCVMA